MFKKFLVVVAGVSLATCALAREDWGDRDRRGRGGGDDRRGMMERMMRMRRGSAAPIIAVGNGMIYVANKGKLYAIDAKSMEMTASVTLDDIMKTEEQTQEAKKMREKAFSRFDKDGDGRITPDEAKRPEIIERFDKNKDGVITIDEFDFADARKRMAQLGMSGPVQLKIEGDSLLVIASGVLARLDPKTLEVRGVVSVGAEVMMENAGRMMEGFGRRRGGRTDDDKPRAPKGPRADF